MKVNGIDFGERYIPKINKQKVAIELVPKNQNYLINRIDEIKDCDYDIVNLPHLTTKNNGKIKFLSPEEILKIENLIPETKDLILHLRTQDGKNKKEVINRISSILKQKVSDLLLVTGDIYNEKNDILTTGDILKLIGKNDKISVCTDLYLNNWGRFNEKVNFLRKSVKSKIFTQPIFTYETIDDLISKLSHDGINSSKENIFGGITWFSNLRQREYWKNINKVPDSYLPNGNSDKILKETSIKRATEIYKELKKRGLSSYIMLMNGEVKDLLEIQNKAENILY